MSVKREQDPATGMDVELVPEDVKPNGASSSSSASKAVPEKLRTTTKFMTKYERARLLGVRALQIRCGIPRVCCVLCACLLTGASAAASMGAPVMVELTADETDPLEIARKELKERRIPIVIRRHLPDESYEDWTVDELIIEQ